jgi:hypothetical protein
MRARDDFTDPTVEFTEKGAKRLSPSGDRGIA